MMSHVSLVTGLVVGLSIAVPIGPMGLLCIQRTLSSGMGVGVSTGLGAATVNVIYGALIMVGLNQAAPFMAAGTRVLGFAGGLFILWSAARTVLQQRGLGARPEPVRMSLAAAYGSAVAFNAGNPLSPILLIALLAPVMTHAAPAPTDAALILLGMFTAAAAWWVCLSGGITLLRAQLSPRLLVVVNQMAGAVLTFYGALALARSLAM